MNFFDFISYSFATQAFIVAVILVFSKRGDRIAKTIWSIFLVLLSFNIFYNVLFWSQTNPELSVKLSSLYFVPLALYGPLFFFFVQRRVLMERIDYKDITLHAIPIIVVLVSCLGIFFLPFEIRDSWTQSGIRSRYLSILNPYILAGGLVLILFYYGIRTYVVYRKYYGKDFEMGLWLKAISFSFIGFCSVRLINFILVSLDSFRPEYYYSTMAIMVLFVIFITYLGLVQPEIFSGNKPFNKVVPFVKYKSMGLSSQLFDEYKEKLCKSINIDKIYLDSDLRLDDLSKHIGISRHHVSQVINEHFEMGFFDLMNKYRVEEFEKILLSDSQNSSIIEIAYKSGFNNKVTFYKAFKKFKGTTPTSFLSKNIAEVQ